MMDRRKWKVTVGVVVAVIVILAGFLVLKFTLWQVKEDVAPKVVEVDLNEAYGYTDVVKVADLMEKFNRLVIAQAELGLMAIDSGMMVIQDGMYWYPLYEDIALVVVPVETGAGVIEEGVVESDDEVVKGESGDGAAQTEFGAEATNIIALASLIYIDKESLNQEMASNYFQCLIRANDEDLGAEEIEGLMVEAETLRERGEMANRGKGIFVAVRETEDHMEYQVVRNYREG